MKIKNDLVSIKIGKRQYDFNNMILNEYLIKFAKYQLNLNELNKVYSNKKLEYCLLKLDTPLSEITENTQLSNTDFDICLLGGASSSSQEIGEQEIIVKNIYKSDSTIYDYNKKTADNYISNYFGKKITAIGFNTWAGDDSKLPYKTPVCAVLDVSNYNIYLQNNQNFTVTRKDIISTDSLFWTNSKKIKGPLHLVPNGIESVVKKDDFITENGIKLKTTGRAYGILYSVGLSSFKNRLNEEFAIGNDIEILQNNNELLIEGLKNFLSKDILYPSNFLYPGMSIYPMKSNYKYLIFKYKVWQEFIDWSKNKDENYISETIFKDTGYCYHQLIPLNEYGNLNIKIKYERS